MLRTVSEQSQNSHLATANIKNIADINTTLKSVLKPFAEILSVSLDTLEHVNMDKPVNFYEESVAFTNMYHLKMNSRKMNMRS